MLEIWKYHSTHFIFLSEVQHISTCSNNVCPYAKEKKNFYTWSTAKFHRSFLSHSMKKLLTKVWSTDSTYQIDFLVICWIWKKKTINQSINTVRQYTMITKKHLETYPHKLEESKNKNMEIVTVTIWHVCLQCLLYQWEM